MAKSGDGGSQPTRRAVDLDDIVLAEVGRVRTRSGVAIDVSGMMPVEVRADPEQLERVVRNLLDNATRHAASMGCAETDERCDERDSGGR